MNSIKIYNYLTESFKLNEDWLNKSVKKLRASIAQEKIEEIEYRCVRKDLLVCLCFFSIVEYKKPIENWIKVTEKLRLAGIPFKSISLLFHGQKTKNIDADYWFESDSLMFYKENLYNVIASKEREFKKICFMDGDLLFDNENWYDDSSCLLDRFDAIQPFDTCKWFDKKKKTIKTGQIASSVGVFQGINFEQPFYQPGFAWCFKRETFEKINGFYDWVSMGEGDMCFINSLIKNKANLPFTKSVAYKKYSENVERDNPKIGFLINSSAYHLYHGTFKNRSYQQRNKYIPDSVCEEPKRFLVKDPGRLMHWRNPKVYNQNIKQYFLDRKEDD